MKKFLFYSLLFFNISACTKDGAGGLVEIYLFKNAPAPPRGCTLSTSNVVLEEKPFVNNNDIYAYSPTDHLFTLSGDALEKIKALGDNLPFALTVNKVPVYYGLNKPMTSSSFCGNVITMSWDLRHGVTINNTNPAFSSSVNDPRNDPGLLVVLRRQRKLR